jgi:general secretion pathway protein A
MYEEFYGLRDNPFRLTPDPDYLFLSTGHQEALGHLLFGVNEGSGVVVISGEIGTGKTTLLRTLVRNLDAGTTVAYIFNPALSSLELLQTINAEFGLPATSTSKKELIDELNHFLLDQQAAGQRVVVIIDEAQNLEPSVLEQLRLLSNLETERAKLLQIILVGQPELRAILARPELAQLDQRVTLRWHLGPLNAAETAAYVRHRLRVAAAMREAVHFSPAALRQVYRFSRGVPRLINILCHRALLIGYTQEERDLGPRLVRQAAKELRRDQHQSQRTPVWRPVLATAVGVALLLVIAGAFLGRGSWQNWLAGEPTAPRLQEEPQAATPERPTASPLPSPVVAGSSSQSPVALSAAPPPPSVATSTAPAVNSSADTLSQELRSGNLIESAIRAVNGLLRTWEADDLQTNELQSGVLDLGTVARRRRLEYLPLTNTTLNQLSLLNLPVILELTGPTRQDARFLLLLGLSGDRCRVLLEGEREVPLEVVSAQWSGNAHLFWKDFENVGFLLAVGSVGQNVRRLHALLSKLQDPTEGKISLTRQDIYSRQTETAVSRFQKTKQIPSDGIVGPLTLVLLYNSLTGYTHPTLGLAASPTDVQQFEQGGETVQGKTGKKAPEVKEKT